MAGGQFFQHIVRGEYRAESGDAPIGNLVHRGEHIAKFELHLAHGIFRQILQFLFGQLAADLLLVQIVHIVLTEFVAAGLLLPFINIFQPVIECIYAIVGKGLGAAGELIEEYAVGSPGQFLVHISEQEEHFNRQGHGIVSHTLFQYLGVDGIEAFRKLAAQTACLFV